MKEIRAHKLFNISFIKYKMKFIILLPALVAVVLSNETSNDENGQIDMEKLVEEINSNPKSTWKASTYDNKYLDIEEIVGSKLGLKLHIDPSKIDPNSKVNPFYTGPQRKHNAKVGAGFIFPAFYDARKEYPKCKSISLIRDQSNCGSCWAVSAASVFSDRICIHSLGYYNISLSGQYTASCDKSNYGCNGGYLDQVWDFYEYNGVTTGGEFQSDEGCIPYALKHCGRYPRKYPCSEDVALTPICRKTLCTNGWYKNETETDIFKVSEWYQVGDTYFTLLNEFLIQAEILQYGPVQAGFLVYKDFVAYKSGIYEHKGPFWKDILGGHAIKIIGWGEEKGRKYWIASNSWTEEWGENGTFRIVRGKNNCFIESMVYAGIPDI